MTKHGRRLDVILTNEELDAYAKREISSRDLIEKYGTSYHTIIDRLKATGRADVLAAIEFNTKKKNKKLDDAIADKLKRLLESGMMKKDIAVELSVRVPTVLAWQRKLGIPVCKQIAKKAKQIDSGEVKCKKPVNRFTRAQALMTSSMIQL